MNSEAMRNGGDALCCFSQGCIADMQYVANVFLSLSNDNR
jgi:hypothetical protein